jgi:asparagine synthetase B (glutamine-hydrolysing)
VSRQAHFKENPGWTNMRAKPLEVGVQVPRCFHIEVPAGTVMRFSPLVWESRMYADPWIPQGTPAPSFEGAVANVASLVKNSVDLRLRSDVEAGVLLSGGLDSVVITALARTRQGGRLSG